MSEVLHVERDEDERAHLRDTVAHLVDGALSDLRGPPGESLAAVLGGRDLVRPGRVEVRARVL